MFLKLVATLFLIYLGAPTANGQATKMDKNGAMSYLQRFGYANLGRSGNGDFRKAIARFQKFFHMKVTGKLDAETETEMLKPRCGNTDDVDKNGRSAQKFRTGSKWRKTSLTYRFLRNSEDVSATIMRSTFRRAFAFWSAVTPLRFTEVRSGRSDFTIMFARRSHGDGAPFDGPGRVLAHAFFPPNGRVHFDEDEGYSVNGAFINGRRGIDLLAVAVHEIGHALGLHHSNVRGSIMWPSYTGYDANLKLHQDDVNGIQSLYGRTTGVVPPRSCSDKNTNCPRWRRYCADPRFVSFMRNNCPKTCNTCGSSCVDKRRSCQYWKSLGYCTGRFVAFMTENCAKSCNKCGSRG